MVTTTVVAVPPCTGNRSGSMASSSAQNACPLRWSAGTRRPSVSSTVGSTAWSPGGREEVWRLGAVKASR
jgi:hypothetical protein